MSKEKESISQALAALREAHEALSKYSDEDLNAAIAAKDTEIAEAEKKYLEPLRAQKKALMRQIKTRQVTELRKKPRNKKGEQPANGATAPPAVGPLVNLRQNIFDVLLRSDGLTAGSIASRLVSSTDKVLSMLELMKKAGEVRQEAGGLWVTTA
jgi:hypothetical protein